MIKFDDFDGSCEILSPESEGMWLRRNVDQKDNRKKKIRDSRAVEFLFHFFSKLYMNDTEKSCYLAINELNVFLCFIRNLKIRKKLRKIFFK